jgi:regulator of protease activity HflC (stomatin/prohibitin superfamily)
MNGLRAKHVLILLAIFLVGGLNSCYCNAWVAESEVGLIMPDGVRVSDVVGSGRYTNLNYFADIQRIDASAKTLVWEDPDLVTADKQPIGLTLGVTYARKRDADSATGMWRQYRGEAISDEALSQQVGNRMARVAKAVTARYSLNEMLGVEGAESTGRQVVTQDLFALLEPELAEVQVQLLDVGINNITPSAEYLSLLEKKANAQVAVEVAKQETKRLNEQLVQEQAQTQIEVEKAKRQNLVNEELSKVYEQSPQYYELEKLRLLKDVVGETDKIYFVPEGTDLTLILGGTAPVVQTGPAE